nr:iduronate 2-sulfatase isoform X2 [Parasteatoda tepidariorum]XP_042905000.1 iduronate 2-sulfatase isoform X3 [Parasteatoda tepidariorum]
MAEINEYTLHQRQILMFVLVCVFVITICAVTLSILIIDPALIEEEAAYSGKQHFLLIVVDDLRPVLGCYGDEKAITPNIDQLAARSVLFKNAYTQQALDGPSRISFLTGRRPDNLHLYDEGFYWRDFVGDFVTLPQHFKNHGYETVSIGKVFSPGLLSNETDDYPQSWSRVPYHPPSEDLEEFCQLPDNETAFNLICPVKLDQTSLPDIESTEFAIDFLKNKSREENKTGPFFLAVGYNKPHIPFKFPKEYLDLYPLESMDLAINHTIPPRLPKISWNPWMDIREKDDVKNLNVNFPYGPLPEDLQKRIRQAYYSSVSYIDDQIGKILNALEESKFADYTTIVLLGDNGWSLGEHQE